MLGRVSPLQYSQSHLKCPGLTQAPPHRTTSSTSHLLSATGIEVERRLNRIKGRLVQTQPARSCSHLVMPRYRAITVPFSRPADSINQSFSGSYQPWN